jgi:hypothetical protein
MAMPKKSLKVLKYRHLLAIVARVRVRVKVRLGSYIALWSRGWIQMGSRTARTGCCQSGDKSQETKISSKGLVWVTL